MVIKENRLRNAGLDGRVPGTSSSSLSISKHQWYLPDFGEQRGLDQVGCLLLRKRRGLPIPGLWHWKGEGPSAPGACPAPGLKSYEYPMDGHWLYSSLDRRSQPRARRVGGEKALLLQPSLQYPLVLLIPEARGVAIKTSPRKPACNAQLFPGTPKVSPNFWWLTQQTSRKTWSTSFRLSGCSPEQGHGPLPLPTSAAKEPVVREGAGGHPRPRASCFSLGHPQACPSGSRAVCSSLPASDVGGLMSRFPRVVGHPACAQWLGGSPL